MSTLTKVAAVAAGLLLAGGAGAAGVAGRVDWPKWLSRQGLAYDRLPETEGKAAVTGNGLMGAKIYLSDDKGGLRFRMVRGEVTVGDLVMVPVGKIKGGAMRLDLWDAEVTGRVETDKGEIRFTAYTHARRPVEVVDIRPTEGERGCFVDFRPVNRAVAGVSGDSRTMKWRTASGEEGAAAWFVNHEAGPRRTVYLSVAAGEGAVGQAARAVYDAAEAMDLEGPHRAWWHDYYPAHVRAGAGVGPTIEDCLRAYYSASVPTTRPSR